MTTRAPVAAEEGNDGAAGQNGEKPSPESELMPSSRAFVPATLLHLVHWLIDRGESNGAIEGDAAERHARLQLRASSQLAGAQQLLQLRVVQPPEEKRRAWDAMAQL